MEITEFSRLNFSVGELNNLLKKAENSITLDLAKDAANTLMHSELDSIKEELQLLKADLAAISELLQNITPGEPKDPEEDQAELDPSPAGDEESEDDADSPNQPNEDTPEGEV